MDLQIVSLNYFNVQGKLEVSTDAFSQDFILCFVWLSNVLQEKLEVTCGSQNSKRVK